MPAARKETVQTARPNACRMREMVHQTILAMEKRIVTLEGKDVLSESYRRSVIRISKMLETICAELQRYHYEIVVAIQTEEATAREQEFFDEHQCKTMEFVDHLGYLLVKPQPSTPTPASTGNRLVDRQLDLHADSVQTIKKAIENPDIVDTHILTSYLDEIISLEGELQGLKTDILSLEDIGDRVRTAFDIKETLFDQLVAILRLTDQEKEEPSPQVG